MLLAHHTLKSFLFLLLAVLVGCGGGGGSTEPVDISLSRVSTNELGLVPAGTYVFRTQSDWDAFWLSHPNTTYPTRQVPTVDFLKLAVVGVFAGVKGRCNRLDITKATTDNNAVIVRYKITVFGLGTPSSCIGSDPFVLNLADMVLVPAGTTTVTAVAE